MHCSTGSKQSNLSLHIENLKATIKKNRSSLK